MYIIIYILTPPPQFQWLEEAHDPQTRTLLGFRLRPADLGGRPFVACTAARSPRCLRAPHRLAIPAFAVSAVVAAATSSARRGL